MRKSQIEIFGKSLISLGINKVFSFLVCFWRKIAKRVVEVTSSNCLNIAFLILDLSVDSMHVLNTLKTMLTINFISNTYRCGLLLPLELS